MLMRLAGLAWIGFTVFLTDCSPNAEWEQGPSPSPLTVPLEFGPSQSWTGDYGKDSLKLVELWKAYWYLDRACQHDSAIEVCKEMIRIGQPLLEERYDSSLYEKYAKAYGGIGWNLMEEGYLDEALQYSTYSFDLLKAKFGEAHMRITEVCQGLAFNHLRRGDYDLALEYVYKSLDLINQMYPENHYYIGNKYGNLAGIYRERGDIYAAIDYYHKEKQNRIEVGKYGPYWVSPILKLVECYLELGDLKAAEDILNFGQLHLATIPGQEEYLYLFDVARANILFEKGEYEKAAATINSYIARFKHWDSYHLETVDLGLAHFRLGEIAQKMGRYGDAKAFFQKALLESQSYRGKGLPMQTAALIEIARLDAQERNYDAALLSLQQALELVIPEETPQDPWAMPSLEGITANQSIVDILSERSKVLVEGYGYSSEKKYLDAAWTTIFGALDYIHSSRAGLFGKNSKVSLSQEAIPLVEQALFCAETLREITNDPEYLQQAYWAVENVKGIILLEDLNEKHILQEGSISQTILDREEALRKELAMYDQLVLEERQKGPDWDSLKVYYWYKKRVAILEARDSLSQVLKKQYPDYYRLKYQLPIGSIQDVQAHLKPGEVLVNYFQGDSSLGIFAIGKRGYTFHRIPWGQSEEALAKGFIEHTNTAWATEDVAAWARDAEQLYDLLFVDGEVLEDPSMLIIIPDGRLGYLPFHLLLASHSQVANFRELPYLFKKCPILYQYSSSLFIEPFHSRKKSTVEYAGFAPEYEGSALFASRSSADSLLMVRLYPEIARDGLSSLAFNQPEVRDAALLWNAEAYTGPAATEETFKARASEARVLHLAMHALTNDEDPLLSQLIFSNAEGGQEDGKLHNYELQTLALSADLTVLSACNTGAGKLNRGEGVMSVSRSFRLAGCPNIVMSLWQANDRSTGQLITRFFQYLKKGEGKAEALRRASLDFLNSADERYTHPFYWGGMVLVGDNDRLSAGWGLTHSLIAVLLIGVVGVMGIWGKKIFLSR